MTHNLAARSPAERAKVNVDLAASVVAYKERLTFPLCRPKLKGSSQRNCANTSGDGCSITGIWPCSSRAGPIRFIRRNQRENERR